MLDPRRYSTDSAKNFYRLFTLLHLVGTVLGRVDPVGQEYEADILDPLDDLDEDTCSIDSVEVLGDRHHSEVCRPVQQVEVGCIEGSRHVKEDNTVKLHNCLDRRLQALAVRRVNSTHFPRDSRIRVCSQFPLPVTEQGCLNVCIQNHYRIATLEKILRKERTTGGLSYASLDVRKQNNLIHSQIKFNVLFITIADITYIVHAIYIVHTDHIDHAVDIVFSEDVETIVAIVSKPLE